MKSLSVTIQLKPFWELFHMLLFVLQHFQNEIWSFSLIIIMAFSGSERVKMVKMSS